MKIPNSLCILALSLTSHCEAINLSRDRPARERRLDASLNIKDFAISNVNAHSFILDPSITTWNRTLSFLFTDPNSNTSTICTQSWTETPSSFDQTSNTTTPMSNNSPQTFALCDYTGVDPDYFQWKFVGSYTTFGDFTIALAHTFRDRVNFEPPFDVPTYFATEVALNLTCVGGGTRCTLPHGSSPLFARVDAIND